MALTRTLWERMADFKQDHTNADNSAPGSQDRQDSYAEIDEIDLNDTSTILNGSKAITGKAIYAANQATRNSDLNSDQKNDQEQREAEERELRELMHLAAWNAEMTTMGGVQMTNEEAQNARQHVIDHEDEYADRAVREGVIEDSERDAFKRTGRQIKHLKELEGRGIATDEQKQECAELQQSRIGRATEGYAAESHAHEHGLAYDPGTRAHSANDAVRRTSTVALDDQLFKSAPDAKADFKKSASPDSPEPKPEQPTPAIAPRVATMGIGV